MLLPVLLRNGSIYIVNKPISLQSKTMVLLLMSWACVPDPFVYQSFSSSSGDEHVGFHKLPSFDTNFIYNTK